MLCIVKSKIISCVYTDSSVPLLEHFGIYLCLYIHKIKTLISLHTSSD